jgi:hypothetical protein
MFDEFQKLVRRDVPLAMFTRLPLGGSAEFFAEPESELDIEGYPEPEGI